MECDLGRGQNDASGRVFPVEDAGQSPHLYLMNRRDFTKLSAAAAASAALPLPALAQSAAPRAAGQAGYIWAVAMAKSQGRVSREMLTGQLGLTPRAARAMQARLVTRGVVSTPNAAGISRAIAPLFEGGLPVPAAVQAAATRAGAPSAPDALTKAGHRIGQVMEQVAAPNPEEAPSGTPEEPEEIEPPAPLD